MGATSSSPTPRGHRLRAPALPFSASAVSTPSTARATSSTRSRSSSGRRGGGGAGGAPERILEFFPRIRERLASRAETLSGGEQQMVAIARALSGTLRLLLLDQPFEGLAPAVSEAIFVSIDRLRREGPILIVEHDLALVLALAGRAYAL